MKEDLALLWMRIGFASLLMTHGWPKFQKVLAGDLTFANPIGLGEAPSLVLAAGAEFVCALLVLLGVYVRWTAIPPAFTMAVAVIFAHAGESIAKREKALLFLVGFVALVILEGGRYSLDALWRRKARAASR